MTQSTFRMLVGAATLALLTPMSVTAQATPKTPWGDPDLQGTYTNKTITPLERPESLGDKEFLTNEEVAALSQSTALVVEAISSLLVATLAIPVAGVPGARPLHHPRDSPHHSLLTGRGQQLTAIQNP